MENNRGDNSIIAWFTKNPVAANLLMVFLIIAGLITAFQIRKEVFPDFKTEIISVGITYPGASPADVEEGIVKKVEDSLQGLEGIKEIEAVSYEGFADISVKAETGADMNDLLDKVKSRVDGIDSFPNETERPTISEVIIKTEVLWLILYGNLDDKNIKTLARQVKDDLVSEDGVSQVNIVGTKSFEISIDVSRQSLEKYSLTFDEVANAVSARSVDLPGGSIKTRGENILLRSSGKAKTGPEFENIIIRTKPDGTIVRVKDVAKVKDGFADEDWFLKSNGKNAVGLQVFRTGDESTLSVAAAVKKFVAENKNLLPPGVSFDIMADMSVPLKERLNLMIKNMALGSFLVFIALALFLRLRIAFWVMMGLPVSFLGALWLMPLPFIDATINMITLYGFILVLGIVVDDAIVIGESIHETIDKEGVGADSVIKGAKAVATPATFGVLTTIAAFVPLITIPGANGKMWAGIGFVVILCLLFSLVESKLILPAHLLHLKGSDDEIKKSLLSKLQDKVTIGLNFFLNKIYSPTLKLCLKHRYATLAAFLGIFLLTMTCVKTGIVRFVFFPQIESDMVQVKLDMVRGTPNEDLMYAIEKIEKAAVKVNKKFMGNGEKENPIKRYVSYSESDSSAGLFVELSKNEVRNISASDVVKVWRDITRDVREMPGVKSLKYNMTMGEAAGSPIDFELSGRSIEKLDKAAKEIKDALREYKGVSDIRDTSSDSKTEIKLSIKPEAEAIGISLLEVAKQVRQAFYGEKVQKVQRGPEQVDVFVRYPIDERRSISDLESMWLRTASGKNIPLSTVAEVKLGQGPAEIIRTDRRRVVSVYADIDKSIAVPGEIIGNIIKDLIPKLEKKYHGVKIKSAGESEEEQKSLKSMKKWALLSLFAIFAMMAVPLKSYVKPFIIMTAIPFGVVGAILGHLFMGLPVSILSLCGIIALSGVVVNDSLVMVDYINQRVEQGDSVKTAVSAAGVRRFRAIMLTSITTFFGLLPMVLEKSLQAQFLIPMAVSLAYGILFATLITLFLIPALYMAWNDVRSLFYKRDRVMEY